MPGAPGAGGAQRSRRPTGWRFPRPGRALAVRTRQNSPQANNWAGRTGGGCGRRVWPVPAAALQSVAPPMRCAHQLALYDMPGESIRVSAARASYQRPCALHSSPHRLLCMGVRRSRLVPRYGHTAALWHPLSFRLVTQSCFVGPLRKVEAAHCRPRRPLPPLGPQRPGSLAAGVPL